MTTTEAARAALVAWEKGRIRSARELRQRLRTEIAKGGARPSWDEVFSVVTEDTLDTMFAQSIRVECAP